MVEVSKQVNKWQALFQEAQKQENDPENFTGMTDFEKKQKEVKKEKVQKAKASSSDKKASTTKKAKEKTKAPVKEPV